MSSYFVNSTFPVTLASGQESFLGQLPLYSSGYADPLRHYPAPYGPGPGQDKGFAASSYYPPAGGGYGRAAPCDYGPAPAFYREKDAACALSGADEPPPFHPEPRKSDCAQDKSVFGETEEQKCSTPVYPWMQRMNSCNSECDFPLSRAGGREVRCKQKGKTSECQHPLTPTLPLGTRWASQQIGQDWALASRSVLLPAEVAKFAKSQLHSKAGGVSGLSERGESQARIIDQEEDRGTQSLILLSSIFSPSLVRICGGGMSRTQRPLH